MRIADPRARANSGVDSHFDSRKQDGSPIFFVFGTRRQRAETVILTSGKIDAVLPLKLGDWERFCILDATIRRSLHLLGTCWIVTPDKDFRELSARIDDTRYQVMPESEIVPEFQQAHNMNGWFKQQLIKVAAAEKMATEFYLVLDADVVCIRNVRYSDLIKDGRAASYVQSRDIHPEWYQWAERVLGLPRSGACHAVTPAVFAREAVLKLQQYLSELAHQNKSTSRNTNFSSPAQRTKKSLGAKHPRPWVLYLLRELPWTEHSLYNTFLEATSQLEQYHFRTRQPLYSTHSLWEEAQIPSWNPHLEDDDGSLFLVVQSSTCIDPQVVRAKLQVLLTPAVPAQ